LAITNFGETGVPGKFHPRALWISLEERKMKTKNARRRQNEVLTARRLTRSIFASPTYLSILLTFAVTCASPAAQADFRIVVPRDFPTIQAAVDAAPPGSP
jgi:hypothetical protein